MKYTKNANELLRRALSYLEAVSKIEKRFQSRSHYRQRLQAMVEGVTPRALGTVRGGSLTSREDILARLTDLDSELAKELMHLQDIREQTWDLFSRLSHSEAGQVLEEFYLNGTSVSVIAAQTGYSERHIYRIKDQALQELGKLLREEGIEDPGPISYGKAFAE